MQPVISVIMPVYNGVATLDRAIHSLQAQTFADWELIAVDDCSTDDSLARLQRWAAADGRIRIERLEENRGEGAARNAALGRARGEFVAYLDQDDEYYPDYLAHVRQLGDRADVLMFGYDFRYEDGPAAGRPTFWDPGQVRQFLFLMRVATPLGVAHRRAWWEKAGGFSEAWCEEDSDLWRRMARAGAQFAFFPLKSGLHHVRHNSADRTRHITQRQREAFLANRQAGKPIFGDRPQGVGRRKVRKIAFVSPHCVIDFTNGAATATLDGLQFLQTLGFDCQAFCNSRLDASEEVLVEQVLAQRKVRFEVRNAQIGPHEGRMIFTLHGKVPVTLFESASTRGGWLNEREAQAFLAACEVFLTKNRPDVVWTYGGDPVSLLVQRLAKRLDIPILIFLHNFGYGASAPFESVDYAVVPSEFGRRFYWETLGLACQKLPLVVDPQRVLVADWRPRYLTFVNPEPRKGIQVFARIAEVLSAQRPDIPMLLVEGIAKASNLPQIGLDLRSIPTLTIMPNTPDAREFLTVTKALVMPSLMENVGLVAMEAMLNGIPVLGSNRGALSETIGTDGLLFDIPARYTQQSPAIPTADEVAPWVETIIRLWDDAAYYEQCSRAVRERSRLWHPDQLATTYRDFFSNLRPQPGPPLVPEPVDALGRVLPFGTDAGVVVGHGAHGTATSNANDIPLFLTCRCLGRSGRLGNQLFQIAATIGTARKNGADFVFPPWHFADDFKRPIPQSNRIPDAGVYIEPSFSYADISVRRPTDLAGCFQSERYFKHCEEEIRSYFAPREECLNYLREHFGHILAGKTCSLHVRRGDYAGNPCYADLAATDYYDKAMACFDADTTFLVFSDDIAWCLARFSGSRFVFVEQQADIVDLFLMTLCRGHIIANSSFSWWGAWLDPRKDKQIIAPSRWFVGNYADPSLPAAAWPNYQGYHDAQDIVPAGWIKL